MSLFKTRKMMADEYGIDRKTLRLKLEKAGIFLLTGNISPADQKRIYEYFGKPPLLMSQITPSVPLKTLTDSKNKK
jgi:hypothetical protein